MSRFAPAPRPGEDEDDAKARQRSDYLAKRHGFTDDVARALAYRELGYSHSGISKKVDVTEATVQKWMDRIVVEYGLGAIETKWGEQREGRLGELTTESLIGELHPTVIAEYLELAQANLGNVPDAVDPYELELRVERWVSKARRDDPDIPTSSIDDVASVLGGWYE